MRSAGQGGVYQLPYQPVNLMRRRSTTICYTPVRSEYVVTNLKKLLWGDRSLGSLQDQANVKEHILAKANQIGLINLILFLDPFMDLHFAASALHWVILKTKKRRDCFWKV